MRFPLKTVGDHANLGARCATLPVSNPCYGNPGPVTPALLGFPDPVNPASLRAREDTQKTVVDHHDLDDASG